MNREQIIHQLFTGKNFNDCIGKMEPAALREDLRQEVILIICELDPDLLIGLWERRELEFYTVKVILTQTRGNRTSFYKKFRDSSVLHTDTFPELSASGIDIEERQLREMIEDMAVEEVDKLYWYNRGLIELYKKHGNFRAIEKETGIPYTSCFKSIKKSFTEIRQKLQA